jgi:phenylacetate-CoA ligase
MRLTSPLRVAADVPRLLRHPHTSRERIIAFQERRLRQLVLHAYENVPYYRRLFDEAGVKPDDIRGLADLKRIPITTKATLQSLGGSEMLARGLKKSDLIARETNGSTGIPLRVYRKRIEQVVPTVLLWRIRRELGLRRGLRVTFLAKFGPNFRPSSLMRRTRTRLLRAAGVRTWTPVESTAPMNEVAARVRESRPDIIGGYAGVLSRLARELGDDQTDLGPRLILSVAEVLTAAMRARIEKVFGAPVRDTYACYELGMIASECPQGGTYHVCDDNVIIEIEGADDTNSGELIGTNLHFTAMPIIRYQLGDVVTRGPDRCACGSPFTTLSAIQGRMNDYFPLPDGRSLHPYRIGTAVWSASFAWMHQYQVIQERRDRVLMRIVARRDPTSEEIIALENAVTAVLGSDVEFVTELVDDIRDEVNGKFRIYRSLVESEYGV